MRYLVLACDYDGTIATNGAVDEATVDALQKCRASGRKLMLVTGRVVPELEQVCPHLDLFDAIVAENGGLLYCPATRDEKLLAEPPHDDFVALLAARGVAPLSVGRTIVATWRPHEETVLRAIRELGLELQVIFNKGAVMILPSGVNKATGLLRALEALHLSPHNVVGVGDAENDHAFLERCEASVAVANALPSVRQRTDLVTEKDHGAGVVQLIERLLADDLAELDSRLTRHYLRMGTTDGQAEVLLPPYRGNVLIVGPSGSGKSSLATAFLERLKEHQYQFCIIDPEGDYEKFESAISFGTTRQPPEIEEVMQLLARSPENAVVNLMDVATKDRPAEFLKVMTRLTELRSATCRPHWILVDEAHHLLPASREPQGWTWSPSLDRMVFITLEPKLLMKSTLEMIDTVIAVGDHPLAILGEFARCTERPAPESLDAEPRHGEVVIWNLHDAPRVVTPILADSARRRHSRKYAEGDLGPDRSFYFRGPQNRLNLMAQNLNMFLQMADGVDDETWQFHRARGDFSAWLRGSVKDESLADRAAEIERQEGLSATEGKQRMRELVTEAYSMPVDHAAPHTADNGNHNHREA